MLRRRHVPSTTITNTGASGQSPSPSRTKLRTGAPFALFFVLLLVIRTIGAFVNPISDCDETFNYWEPMHFLLYGFGLQTWEYSPQFALRSYAYLYPYAAVAKAANLTQTILPLASAIQSPKILQFYALRIALATLSASAELSLIRAVATSFTPQLALLLSISLASSPGMFRAASEFLPSSFAMLCITAAHSAWLRRSHFLAVFFVALASLLGWIFAAIVGLPIALDIINFQRRGLINFVLYAAASGLPIVAVMCAVDSWHFGRFVLAPLNHILYNVFPSPGTGSQLYGTEPALFYAINLFLNVPVAAILFILYPFVLIVLTIVKPMSAVRSRVTLVAGAYLALVVFVSQPHKEERFLAPIYPLICLAAALCVHDATSMLPSRILSRLTFAGFIAVSVLLGGSRAAMQVWSFRAPLRVYSSLSDTLLKDVAVSPAEEINVCVGDEWYRFPGNMFVPMSSVHIRFVRAGFDGALPMAFTENGTYGAREGLNEFNRAVDAQFFDGVCDYWVTMKPREENGVDSGWGALPNGISEPDVVTSAPFVDSSRSPGGLRAFYFPAWSHRLRWLDYVLVRNATRG